MRPKGISPSILSLRDGYFAVYDSGWGFVVAYNMIFYVTTGSVEVKQEGEHPLNAAAPQTYPPTIKDTYE